MNNIKLRPLVVEPTQATDCVGCSMLVEKGRRGKNILFVLLQIWLQEQLVVG